jgi:hypothetical protein
LAPKYPTIKIKFKNKNKNSGPLKKLTRSCLSFENSTYHQNSKASQLVYFIINISCVNIILRKVEEFLEGN